MALAQPYRTPLGFVLFGLALAGFGGLLAALSSAQDPNPVEAAVLLDAEGLTTARVGKQVLVEGRVASSMPVVEEGLAVIQRQVVEAQQKSGGSSEVELRWRVQASDKGPVEVEVGGAKVKLGLSNATWREPPRAVPESDARVAGKTRLLGFAPGDPISALVMVDRKGGELWLEAEEIFGGTAAGFRDHVALNGRALSIVGGGFGGTGVLLVLVGLALALRRRAG